MLAILLPAGCDRLEDSGIVSELLPGRWAFSYRTSEELGFELTYKSVVFEADGHCALLYNGGEMAGTYRANDATIRIEAIDEAGQEHVLLWQVLTVSPRQLVTEYHHQLSDGRIITISVTLDRL